MSLGGSSVAVVQLPGGQFQVQGVIQSAQPSVIQSPHSQAAQVRPTFLMLQLMHVNNSVFCFQAAGSDSEDSQDSSDSGAATQKTREILARRPSYRWRPQEKTKRTNSSLSLTLTCGSSTPVEKSWTTCRLKRWRMPRGRTTVQLPQALLYPRLPSTRPAPASTVRPPVCHSNRTVSASTTMWPLIVHILLPPVWWSQLL